MDALEFLKQVLDPRRLAVLGMVAARPRTADELRDEVGLRPRELLAILGPLVQAHVLEHDGDRYRLRSTALREMALDLPQAPPPAARMLFGMTGDEQTVLSRFFRGERLTEVPTQRSKRLVVLERLALEFEPGVRYEEAEVNATLQRFHPDYAALRRYLVDEGFLDRGEGRYWRAGGRV